MNSMIANMRCTVDHWYLNLKMAFSLCKKIQRTEGEKPKFKLVLETCMMFYIYIFIYVDILINNTDIWYACMCICTENLY